VWQGCKNNKCHDYYLLLNLGFSVFNSAKKDIQLVERIKQRQTLTLMCTFTLGILPYFTMLDTKHYCLQKVVQTLPKWPILNCATLNKKYRYYYLDYSGMAILFQLLGLAVGIKVTLLQRKLFKNVTAPKT
jgi:hypothetical protein